MANARQRIVRHVMTGVLCSQGLLGLAAAESPWSRVLTDRSVGEQHRASASRTMAAPRLDLSLPAAAAGSSVQAGPVTAAEGIHAAAAANEDEFASQPAWRGVAPSFVSATHLQDLMRNRRRDGVPLAHLWQSRGVAVSLGLNPKGKPGLWFVKSVR